MNKKMNSFVNIKIELKKEIIDYFDKIKSDIDIRTLELTDPTSKNISEEENSIVYKTAKQLIDLIDYNCSSCLNDINSYFVNAVSDESQDINEIKKSAINSYSIYLRFQDIKEQFNYMKLGFLFTFDWFIEENELNFIRSINIFFDKKSILLF